MRLNTHILFLPSLFVITGALAQLSGSATSGTPAVTYPADGAFVFCSAQDCTGTCGVVDASTVPADDSHGAPNGMGFLSMYWYNPGNYAWDVYTCVDYYNCGNYVSIGSDTCYNLYDNGVATDFYEYFYFVQGGYG
ncbi:hypothetical protein J3R83DRAFT_1378, partial [Lanmaoa asiatica]